MGYYRKWKPSKTKAREFANTMDNISEFCQNNGIHQSKNGDSYYFTLNGKSYRVSNHTIAASNKGAFDDFGQQVRELYHKDGEEPNVVYITAGKTRIIEIYNDLKAGYCLDRRGYRKAGV